jgi:hypothetical protein
MKARSHLQSNRESILREHGLRGALSNRLVEHNSVYVRDYKRMWLMLLKFFKTNGQTMTSNRIFLTKKNLTLVENNNMQERAV